MVECDNSKQVTPNHPILLEAQGLGFPWVSKSLPRNPIMFLTLDLYPFRMGFGAKVVPGPVNHTTDYPTNTIFPIFLLLLSSNCDMLAM